QGAVFRIALKRMRTMHEITGQVHWHEPSGFKRAGFGKFGRPKTPYDLFMEADEIPIYRDIGVSKVQNLPLKAWPRLGGRGSYIQLHGTEGKWGSYVVEVPGAGALNPEKHIYEEIYLVVEGRGSTEVWLEGDSKRHVFEWQKGSLFSIPVNAMHRIVNASSTPALLLGGTTAPNLMNLINDVGAIFDCPYQFRDRFSGADDFYKYKDDIEPDPVRGLAMRRTNFIPDIVNCDLPLDNRRSPGWRRVEPFMTGNTFYLWIGQHENGHYSKAHAHTSAAVLICVKGKGYTYTWPEQLGLTPWKDGKAAEVKRVDYEPVDALDLGGLAVLPRRQPELLRPSVSVALALDANEHRRGGVGMRLGIMAVLVLADPQIEGVAGHERLDAAPAGRAAVVERQIAIDDVGNEIGAPHGEPAHRIGLDVVFVFVEIVGAGEAVAELVWAVEDRIGAVDEVHQIG